jgi:methionyl-tRNA synthetase
MASHEDYNLPWNVSATEFLQFKGEKASKSLRIGIWIDEALEMFPPDYWRYFLIATRPETKDSNFSWEIFAEKINAELNDTFGNFVHRTLSFINRHFESKIPEPGVLENEEEQVLKSLGERVDEIAGDFEACRLQSAANSVMGIGRLGNQYLNEKEPWNLIKSDKAKAATTIYVAAQVVKALVIVSAPIIPFTAEELWKTLNLPGSVHQQRWEEALKPLPAGHKIGLAKPLFRKIEADEKKLDEMLEKVRKAMAK